MTMMNITQVFKNTMLCLAGLFILLPYLAFAQESIPSFESTLTLKDDGTFRVVERIVYDVGGEERRGIYRYITKQHPQGADAFWKDRMLHIEILDVTMDGTAYPYTITDSRNEIQVRIGDPDILIEGEHTFVLTYEVSGGYSYFDDGSAEVYWNVTGNGWDMPIAHASAHMEAPDGMLIEPAACYAGEAGSSHTCEQASTTGSLASYAQSNIGNGAGLTIAHAVDASRIAVVIHERYNIFPFLLMLTTAFIAWMGLFAYRHKTANKTNLPVIAQYEPYKTFKPMYAGMMLDGSLDPQDITAGIVHLAEQGFLRITKTERKALFLFEVDDYSIELQRPLSEAPDRSSMDTLHLLFSEHATVGQTVSLHDLSRDTTKQQQNLTVLETIRKDIKKDMHAEGFLEKKDGRFKQPLLAFCALVLVLVCASFYAPTALILVGMAAVCLLVVAIVLYERKTVLGYEAVNHLKGFKLFLSVTDAERFAFHNAPQKSPEQFMEYLPYAIAFGVEKQWAEVFKDMTIPNPSWYGSSTSSSFSPVSFAASMGAFSSSLSSASSSSGSSGSGSSGGGGGGGGGGGW